MGIRFLCTACHKKLNVKGFLAGKKGVCPKCGASILIPLESQLPGKSDGVGEPEQAAVASEGAMQPFSPTAVETPVAAPTQASPVGQANPAGQVPQPSAVPVASMPAEQQIPQPAAFPTPTHEQAVQSPVAVSGAVSPAPAAAIPNQTIPNPAMSNQPLSDPAVPYPAASGPAPVSVALAATPSATPVSAPATPTPPAAPQPDPISEDPNLIWYVRPPSGGQFGPAKGDIMRKWIEEGRVSEDSLIWREGWADWQKAGEVIPSMAPADATPAQTTTQPVTTRTAGSTATAHRSRRRKNNQLALISVIMLVFVSLALLVTLIFKLQG